MYDDLDARRIELRRGPTAARTRTSGGWPKLASVPLESPAQPSVYMLHSESRRSRAKNPVPVPSSQARGCPTHTGFTEGQGGGDSGQ